MTTIGIKIDKDCVPVEATDGLKRQYRRIKIRGQKSGILYKDVLGGKAATLGNRLGHIRNRSTPGEALVADFIQHNDGAFLEVEF